MKDNIVQFLSYLQRVSCVQNYLKKILQYVYQQIENLKANHKQLSLDTEQLQQTSARNKEQAQLLSEKFAKLKEKHRKRNDKVHEFLKRISLNTRKKYPTQNSLLGKKKETDSLCGNAVYALTNRDI